MHEEQEAGPNRFLLEGSGLGVGCDGVKGSGKTHAGVTLAEPIGTRAVPVVVCDREGDDSRVVEGVPTGAQRGQADRQRESGDRSKPHGGEKHE